MSEIVAVVPIKVFDGAPDADAWMMMSMWSSEHLVCLTSDGDVVEFRGRRKAHDMMTYHWVPRPGLTIATADDLGGDEWREWLRGEGLI